MPTTVPDQDRLYVLVGIISNASGELLIQQRRPGTPKAGQWEFPGGKREPGESPQQALTRELEEELGITVTCCERLLKLRYDYDHASVLLDTFFINGFEGQPVGREGQSFSWVAIDDISSYDVLEAVHPLVDAVREYRSGA